MLIPLENEEATKTLMVLREFVPKGVSIHHLTEEHILSFESALNNRPRKILGYQTAEEAFDATA